MTFAITKEAAMSTINLRIDEELKEHSYTALKKLGVTPSEYLRQALHYVATQNELPFKATVLTKEDQTLLDLARERLAKPQKGIKVSLDEL